MARKRKKLKRPLTPLAALVFVISIVICLLSFAVSYVICVDRVAEFSNGWQYQNKWLPFRGGGLSFIFDLPTQLYIAVRYFPHACFISLLFYPLVILIVPIYDVVMFRDPTILLVGYLPFLVGCCLFLWAGYLADRARVHTDDDPLDMH